MTEGLFRTAILRTLRSSAFAAALLLPANAGTSALASEGDFADNFEHIAIPDPEPEVVPGAVDVTAIEAPLDTQARSLGEGVASYYGRRFHGRLTASGTRFDMHAMTAAHRTLPFGSKVRVTNPRNGKSVIVRINDRGPYAKGRAIDLSRAAAEEIGMIRRGHAKVELELLES
ncbi:septal ring lytic transglycosylase RlpA family protein [Altererythrobacter sp. MF3-039]|uniref:septal ring lytic transglycosylase RlpA family protein n=1 Tax=Altererythrobacter sp. MF3-039 TaxID=3252901 RepID=UPI00390CAF76